MRTRFTGCGTALVTPFAADGGVDEARVRALARRQIDAGIHFLVPCGTTGEVPTLTSDERRRVVELVVEETGGRVPVVAGAGGYNTAEVVEQARDMQRAGVDGLLSVTPYYNKPTPDGLVEHYKAVAGASSLPVILYNVPSRTGCNIDPRTLARLAAIPNVVGIKESSGSLFQISEVCTVVPEGFIVVSGDDLLTLPLMAVGGHGVISVAANEIPAELTRLVELFEQGHTLEAQRLHKRLVPLLLGNFIESNPIPVKHVMAQMGLLEERYRLPMVPPRVETREKLARIIEELGLRSGAEVRA
ncbi:MAG: 4-hydroxy-tetrahydrodipicolinate synthase [Luteitalea sp.]|nr:4-hydroxy-tetrahydrodipicolinate synthase [Luteitalea sp.]